MIGGSFGMIIVIVAVVVVVLAYGDVVPAKLQTSNL